MASYKVEICLKKKTHPSTNIPLPSYRKSEQQKPNWLNRKQVLQFASCDQVPIPSPVTNTCL